MITAGLLKQHSKKVTRYLDYVQPFLKAARSLLQDTTM